MSGRPDPTPIQSERAWQSFCSRFEEQTRLLEGLWLGACWLQKEDLEAPIQHAS